MAVKDTNLPPTLRDFNRHLLNYDRKTNPRENYDSKIAKQMANVIHNGEPNPQNNF